MFYIFFNLIAYTWCGCISCGFLRSIQSICIVPMLSMVTTSCNCMIGKVLENICCYSWLYYSCWSNACWFSWWFCMVDSFYLHVLFNSYSYWYLRFVCGSIYVDERDCDNWVRLGWVCCCCSWCICSGIFNENLLWLLCFIRLLCSIICCDWFRVKFLLSWWLIFPLQWPCRFQYRWLFQTPCMASFVCLL